RDVVDEMAWLAETYEFRSFYFDDDTFNIGKSRMLAFCKELKERRLNLPWSIMARADTMDREILESMAAARLFSIKYGVESADQSILDGSGKNLDLSRVHDTVQITRDLGIQYHLTFTFGLPGETQETAMKTIELALKLNPNTVQFSICTPMPGSKYYDFLEEKGYLSQKGWDAYTGFNSAVVRTDALSERDLEAILEHANRAWNKHVWQRKSFAEKTQVMIRKWGNTILGRCFS
ncbi:hypothetical protein JW979_06180, partial [bacterium]|nr:hypothetical protein [candidate division CSSED10-310 bacterium]